MNTKLAENYRCFASIGCYDVFAPSREEVNLHIAVPGLPAANLYLTPVSQWQYLKDAPPNAEGVIEILGDYMRHTWSTNKPNWIALKEHLSDDVNAAKFDLYFIRKHEAYLEKSLSMVRAMIARLEMVVQSVGDEAQADPKE